jgi:hypothetical protein
VVVIVVGLLNVRITGRQRPAGGRRFGLRVGQATS